MYPDQALTVSGVEPLRRCELRKLGTTINNEDDRSWLPPLPCAFGTSKCPICCCAGTDRLNDFNSMEGFDHSIELIRHRDAIRFTQYAPLWGWKVTPISGAILQPYFCSYTVTTMESPEKPGITDSTFIT